MKANYLHTILLLIMTLLMGCQTESAGAPTATPPSEPTRSTPSVSPSTLVLVDEDEPGEPLEVIGWVQDSATGQPIANAVIDVHQTAVSGLYEEDENGNARIRGAGLTDENGRFQLITILPGHYPNDPNATRHIHINISADGYAPMERAILFDNDPNLTDDLRDWPFGVIAELSQDETAVWQTEIEFALEPAASEAVETFTLIAEQSSASYAVEEEIFAEQRWLDAHNLSLGSTTAIGTTSAIEGSLQIDRTQSPPRILSSSFVVDLMTLTSDQEGRDNTVRRDLFENGRLSTATFTINSLQNFPNQYGEGEPISFEMNGDLTIGEVTQAVDFVVTAVIENNTITTNASSTIQLSDFGMTPPSLLGILTVSNDVMLSLNFTFEGDA